MIARCITLRFFISFPDYLLDGRDRLRIYDNPEVHQPELISIHEDVVSVSCPADGNLSKRVLFNCRS